MPYDPEKHYDVTVKRVVTVANILFRPRNRYRVKGDIALQLSDEGPEGGGGMTGGATRPPLEDRPAFGALATAVEAPEEVVPI